MSTEVTISYASTTDPVDTTARSAQRLTGTGSNYEAARAAAAAQSPEGWRALAIRVNRSGNSRPGRSALML